MTNDLQQQVLAYLQQHQVVTLATIGEEGIWAAAVFYVNDGFDLLFLSAGHTRHARNLATTPQVAATIQSDSQEWTSIQGIQMEGSVIQLYGRFRNRAFELYQLKFPFVAGSNAVLARALAGVNWYRLRPKRLFFVDNRKGFGHRDEVSLSPG